MPAPKRAAKPTTPQPVWSVEMHKTEGFAVLLDGEQITRVDTRKQGEDYIARMTDSKED